MFTIFSDAVLQAKDIQIETTASHPANTMARTRKPVSSPFIPMSMAAARPQHNTSRGAIQGRPAYQPAVEAPETADTPHSSRLQASNASESPAIIPSVATL